MNLYFISTAFTAYQLFSLFQAITSHAPLEFLSRLAGKGILPSDDILFHTEVNPRFLCLTFMTEIVLIVIIFVQKSNGLEP
jgi:hypothetical protein